MANNQAAKDLKRPLQRLLQVLNLERKEIGAIYFYAILAGVLQLAMPLGIQAIINFVLAGRLSTSIIVLIVLVVISVFFTGLLQVNQMKIIEKIQQRIFTRYSFEFAWRIPRLDLKKIDQYYLPEFVNRFFDTINLEKSLSRLLLDIPAALIQVLFGLILLSLYANVFIIFSLLVLLILVLIIRITYAKGLSTSLDESEYKYEVAGWLEEIARVLKSFQFSRGSSLPVDKTDLLVTKYLHARTSHFRVLMLQYWSLVGFKILITAGMLIVGAFLLVSNEINVGQFAAAEIVILLVLASVEKLIRSLDKIYDILTAVEKLGKVIDKPLEPEGTLGLDAALPGVSIQVNNVSFSYNDQRPILNNLSLKIAAGEKVCIRGGEGSGKSTFLKLLTGAYSDFDGNILMNDVPLGNYKPVLLRSETGILFNRLEIFQGTLYENITLGDTNITTSQINALAARLGISEFIASLKKGFDTEIDAVGNRLSSAVIRKVLLLRALVSSPKLLLLEEPWLGLDPECRRRIEQYLLQEIPATTVVVITNDDSFANRCNRVFYMHDGKVVREEQPISKQ
ncbi:peptidase domain-containing ABC transporter [Lacibacter sp.]|uniref:peptidase domain-containing ABC transporter n=1 Tax=Lacibacter sp. TaxID=1915409 RepID=UPI002B4B36F4|nr:ATP-binding cassette domain-containing protein [Lacibacter sp.]HLP35428.1 ATP-binding cassette domain-containing protein [Lacibacter sp.]